MAAVQHQTRPRPRAQQGSPPGRLAVQPEVVHGGVVQPVQHVGAGCEIVHLLGEGEVPRVEDAAGQPGGRAHVGKHLVERAHGVELGDEGADLGQAVEVRPEVEGAAQHAEGLLHAEEALEGPLAVELDDGGVGC